jgi:hypothetical protein
MAYTAFITTLKNVQKDPKSDRLYTAQALGEGVIVGGDAVEGQRVIYFPADGCLCNYDFAMAFNLLRKDKDGQPAGGYLEPSMHIKALKLRGLRSEGITIDLAKFAGFYKLTAQDFKDGEAIDKIGNELICKKYIPRRQHSMNPKTSTKGKKKAGIVFPEFDMHIDTAQLMYNETMFTPGDKINISLKMHGTSQRSMNTYAEYPNGFFRRLFRMKPKRKDVFALGTRRVVLLQSSINDGTGFYGNDSFRVPHHEKLRLHVLDGMEVFYEVVGFVNENTTVMPSSDNKKLNDKAFVKQYGQTTDFTYGCEPGQSEMYVYRITANNGEIEFTPAQIVEWCNAVGVNHVPFLEDFEFTTWEDLLERVNKYADGPDPIGKTHVREGVVVRIVNKRKFTAYKFKNMSFKILEGIVKADAVEADMEEAQDESTE